MTGHAKITDFDVAKMVIQHICRLQITMNNPVLVHVLDSLQKLLHNPLDLHVSVKSCKLIPHPAGTNPQQVVLASVTATS